MAAVMMRLRAAAMLAAAANAGRLRDALLRRPRWAPPHPGKRGAARDAWAGVRELLVGVLAPGLQGAAHAAAEADEPAAAAATVWGGAHGEARLVLRHLQHTDALVALRSALARDKMAGPLGRRDVAAVDAGRLRH